MTSLGENPSGADRVEFGAVYFRKTNPPAADWDRDYRVAVEDGHTMFRHWVPWGAVEIAPGVYDWADYDRHLDLAAEHGIRTVLAEMIVDVPEWLYHRHPHARREMADGRRRTSEMQVSCVTGGHHAMCLDNPEVAEAAGRFLRELARRYKDHPGLYAYDIWNECSNYRPELLCYCPATQEKFRDWLKAKYGDLSTVAKAWFRYSYTDWDQVELPRTVKPYPDVMDAIQFQNDNAFAWMQWRAEQLKAEDDRNPVAAHGNGKSHADIAPACGDDWRAGELVDIFGYTYWYDNDCDPMLAGDEIRSAARGRTYWRAEAIGDSDWKDRQVGDARAIRQDAMHEPENIRLDCMMSLATGARGFLNPRWRGLLDGPLFGAFGWYDLDGSRTDRSRMITSIAGWANTPANAELWRSRPVRGQVAVLLLEEAQAHCYAMFGDTELYSLSLQGAYEAFLHENVQADVVKLDQIGDHSILYVPFSLGMSQATIDTLVAWVRGGGTLVGEAAFGYLSEHAHAFEHQPSRGLAELFGCRQESVNFGVDRWGDLDIDAEGGRLAGGLLRQSFTLDGGTAAGKFDDGSVAIVDHEYGAGRTRIVGSMPGYGYKTRPSASTGAWFRSLLALGGASPHLTIEGDARGTVRGRLSESENARFLWLVNVGEEPRTVTVTLDPALPAFGDLTALRGTPARRLSDRRLEIDVDGRDASIVALS